MSLSFAEWPCGLFQFRLARRDHCLAAADDSGEKEGIPRLARALQLSSNLFPFQDSALEWKHLKLIEMYSFTFHPKLVATSLDAKRRHCDLEWED